MMLGYVMMLRAHSFTMLNNRRIVQLSIHSLPYSEAYHTSIMKIFFAIPGETALIHRHPVLKFHIASIRCLL